MVEKRKIASEEDEELKRIREAKQRLSMTRGMTTPQGQLIQPESTVPRMDPLLLQARNRNWLNQLKAYVEELERRAPDIASQKQWDLLKNNFYRFIERAPPQAAPVHLRGLFEPLQIYLWGYCDAKGIKEADINKGLVNDKTGLPVFLTPKKPGEDPEVK
jgi:hypothetical protein